MFNVNNYITIPMFTKFCDFCECIALCYTIQTLIGLFIVEEEFAIAPERHYYNLQLCAEHLPI